MQLEDIGPRLRDLENRLERLEKRNGANTSLDTARMDWLEANHAQVTKDRFGGWTVDNDRGVGAERDTLRAAIDAAMNS